MMFDGFIVFLIRFTAGRSIWGVTHALGGGGLGMWASRLENPKGRFPKEDSQRKTPKGMQANRRVA